MSEQPQPETTETSSPQPPAEPVTDAEAAAAHADYMWDLR